MSDGDKLIIKFIKTVQVRIYTAFSGKVVGLFLSNGRQSAWGTGSCKILKMLTGR